MNRILADQCWKGYHGHMKIPFQPIKVILADDHAIVRAGIRRFLETNERIQVVAEASNGRDLLNLLESHRPNVVVLDIQMPVMNGIQTTREIRDRGFSVGILILTAYDDPPYVQALIRSGANGYVLKTAEPAEIIQGVLDVFDGRQVIDAALKETMLEQTGKTVGQASADITERELDVLRQAAAGLTNKAIAIELNISSRTVQNHLANIFLKLSVENRTEAVLKSIQMGLLKMDPEQNKPSLRA